MLPLVLGELEVEDGDEKMIAAGDCDDDDDDDLRSAAAFCAGCDVDGWQAGRPS